MKMVNMKLAEEIVREFLVFRGFTNTLQSFDKELSTDIGKGFQVDKILDLIFSVYILKFEADKLIDLLSFFKKCFTYSDSNLITVIAKIEESIFRYYIVSALKCGRKDKVLEFFGIISKDLLRKDDGWNAWFALPYLQNPHLEPRFRVYFSQEWYRTMYLSIRNFLSEMLNGSRTPALLKISSEREDMKNLKKDIKQLNLKVSALQTLLEEKEALLCMRKGGSEDTVFPPAMSKESRVRSTSKMEEIESVQIRDNVQSLECRHSRDTLDDQADDRSTTSHLSQEEYVVGNDCDLQSEEDFAEVKAAFQDTFLGHTSPISCCRFSASGENIASASVDGTVRIWTYNSTAPTSRNATIYCGAEIMSLEWDCKSDRLLLIGTSDGGIKAWNVDSKRVVCDLKSTESYPSILDLKCSPVEPIFVSAAASRREGTGYYDKLRFASLTVWNMRTWKAMTVLPLGKDPPAITSLSFNHNGKLLAAAAIDGLIHMFDMSVGQQITGWPAHDCAISSILFRPDETSIFSLGTDGNIFEWSLHNQGKIMWTRNCIRFCNPDNSLSHRHGMALDSKGRKLLVTSSSTRAPIYQVQGCKSGMKTLSHTGSITTVDWHPSLPIFLTGSADHSVRVTSIS